MPPLERGITWSSVALLTLSRAPHSQQFVPSRAMSRRTRFLLREVLVFLGFAGLGFRGAKLLGSTVPQSGQTPTVPGHGRGLVK